MNEIKVTLTGNVCADPEPRFGKNGSQFAIFRVAVNEGWMGDNGWVDGATTYLRVSAFDSLGRGVLASVRKGHPVIVHGRLRVGSWTTNTGETRSAPEVRASAIGHDLTRGTAAFVRLARDGGPAGSTSVQGGDERGELPASSAGPAQRLGSGASSDQDAWSTGARDGDDEPNVDLTTGEVLDDPEDRELVDAEAS